MLMKRGVILMELRTLEYFLAIAREGSISDAAKSLHVTQPTLSRQLAALEQEFGRQLYTRSHKGIELTDHGIMLQRYAASIVDLANKAVADMKPADSEIRGTVHIGAGETYLMGIVAQAMKNVHEQHPGITFSLSSGTTADLKDRLIKGYFDVMLECEVQDHAKLNVLRFPIPDTWGVLMRQDDPLATKNVIRADDLVKRDLITSKQGMKFGKLADWFGDLREQAHVVAEYQLGLNTRYLVKQGFGVAVIYQNLVNYRGDADLCIRPLSPAVESWQGLVWRKTLPNKQTLIFLDEVRHVCRQVEAGELIL